MRPDRLFFRHIHIFALPYSQSFSLEIFLVSTLHKISYFKCVSTSIRQKNIECINSFDRYVLRIIHAQSNAIKNDFRTAILFILITSTLTQQERCLSETVLWLNLKSTRVSFSRMLCCVYTSLTVYKYNTQYTLHTMYDTTKTNASILSHSTTSVNFYELIHAMRLAMTHPIKKRENLFWLNLLVRVFRSDSNFRLFKICLKPTKVISQISSRVCQWWRWWSWVALQCVLISCSGKKLLFDKANADDIVIDLCFHFRRFTTAKWSTSCVQETAANFQLINNMAVRSSTPFCLFWHFHFYFFVSKSQKREKRT